MSASSAPIAPTIGSTRNPSNAAVRPIRTPTDHAQALRQIEGLMHARPLSPEGDRLDVLVTLVEAFEASRHPIDAPDPIAAIVFMMEQKHLSRRDLEPAIGSRARVGEILNRRRPLTLPMIRALSTLLDLPADILIQPYALPGTKAGPAPSISRP